MKTGFFEMQDTHEILKCGNITAGRDYCINKVNTFLTAHPKAKEENLSKVQKMIFSARNLSELSLNVSNFILAHPSEGLAVK